jgi:hypothetical protein
MSIPDPRSAQFLKVSPAGTRDNSPALIRRMKNLFAGMRLFRAESVLGGRQAEN